MNHVCFSAKLSQNSHQDYPAKNGGSYPCLDDFSPEITLGWPEYKYEVASDRFVARYYDATIGRFISPDTIVPNPANPQSLNRYSYCLNNPLKYIDPTGHTNIWESLTRGIVEQYLIDNWDDPNNTYITDSGRTLGRALSSSDPAGMFDVIAPEGIDSDWADMLDEDGVGWGSKVQLQTGSDYVTSFILEPTLDCYAQLLNWSIYTTGQRDQGNIHTLRVYDSVTGKRVGKAKLNDGNGWWDRNGDNVKIIGAAVGGCLIMATGFGVIAGAGVIFAAGVTGGTAYTAIVAASVAAPIAYGGYAVMDAGLQVATSSDKKQVSFPTLPPGANLE